MSDGGSDRVETRGWLAPSRVGVGLAQGLALFGLYQCSQIKVWPATAPALYWPLVLLAAFWPVLVLGGLGALRRRTLIAWSALAGALILGLAAYDIWRQASGSPPSLSPEAALAIAAALFIGHHLVAGGDAERRWIASYPTYYDVAWKSVVQLALSGLFTGAFWALLALGAALFKLIGVSGFQDVIQKAWFAFPATGLMFALAVHLTDARANLTRGVRTIGLALLSWLMPLMAAIVAAFVIALPFTGLGPLWKTGAAADVLLAAAGALIVLLNATYHDGAPERRPVAALRWAGRGAAILILPLVLIAAYGVLLRVGQYGWTPQRIIALACALVGACYGGGYVWAAVSRGPWLKRIERTNLVAAFVVLGVIVALFSPILDPARISVGDQVGRLVSGRTSPDRFDFRFLRFGGQRFGQAALRDLQARRSGPNAAAIAQKAQAAQKPDFARQAPGTASGPLAAGVTVYPKGKSLPRTFLAQRWEDAREQSVVGPCIAVDQACDGFLADMDGDGAEEVLLADDSSLWVYKAGVDGIWAPVGTVEPMSAELRKQLEAGLVPVAPQWKDLAVGGRRLLFIPDDAARTRLTPLKVVVK